MQREQERASVEAKRQLNVKLDADGMVIEAKKPERYDDELSLAALGSKGGVETRVGDNLPIAHAKRMYYAEK